MALLQSDVTRIAPGAAVASEDRAPDWVAAGSDPQLARDLGALLEPARVLTRATDLIRYASDASPYRLFPRVVVQPRDEREVADLMGYARRRGLPLVFRAGGTSLNGQSQTDGILVDVRRHWSGIRVAGEGETATVRPGTVVGHVNRALARHRRKLGPDPASVDFATVGGVIANNSGGMRCGVRHDSYMTVRSMRLVLPSGTVIDTAEEGAAERFAEAEPDLAAGLAEIRDEIRADAELAERIRRKFAIKNTMGYRLCAFLDADEPLEILRRLVVGSEGTLAFVSEATFDTVAVPRRTTVTWIHFPDIDGAVAPVPDLVAAGATAVELMVAPALMVAANSIPGAPKHWLELPPDSAALLVEFGSDDEADLDEAERRTAEILDGHELVRGPEFTRDAETTEVYWRVREGMHGLVGRLRPESTALIVEDVCVAPERIGECAKDLQALLGKHGFLTGVAGHASAGNLHFMLAPKFDDAADRERYDEFMGELVDLIVGKYDGSLKAEHGTGVNMAPHVEREWGEAATRLMWRIKRLADPHGVLGPDVILTEDEGIHLRNLKYTPPIEEEATACVECGFCEPVCPSRDLTTTPRQRIVLRREMARHSEGSPVLEALRSEFEYDGLDTCAADGTCRLACPLGIDTGKLVKEMRGRRHSERAERMALRAAERWDRVEAAARSGLRMADAIERVAGEAPLRGVTRAARRVAGTELVPEWGEAIPRAAGELPETARDAAAAVYLPACINRIFGHSPRGDGGTLLPEALVEVSRRAGLPLWIPPDVAGTCCATPWASKGYERGASHMARETATRIWRWSEEGVLPVVVDASSCTHAIASELSTRLGEEDAERHGRVEILDSIEWAERLLERLEVSRRVGSATVHPTCGVRHLGLSARLERLAGALAEEVVVPARATCCGFAGDRGLLHPELTEAATREQADEVLDRRFDAHLSSNRTCEAGLERATGRPYRSVIQVLEELTRPSTD